MSKGVPCFLLIGVVVVSIAVSASAGSAALQLGGRVWNDTNGNGVVDPGEPGLNGVTVKLSWTDATGTSRSATTLTASGSYAFSNLPAGAYKVSVVSAPGATVQTYDADGLRTPNAITVNLTQSVQNVSFGYRCTNPAQIGDTVWNDLNADGFQDPGELGIPGIPVALYLDGVYLMSQTTDDNGHYLFTDLTPGTYTVTTDMSGHPELVQTFDYDGIDTPNTATYTVGPDEVFADDTGNSTGLDFGYRCPPGDSGVIGDTVWLDQNANGIQDNGEAGIPNARVKLYLNSTLIGTKVTDAGGHYLFTHLLPGAYKAYVVPAYLPPGLTQTFDYDGLATPNTARYTLDLGEVFADDEGNSTGLDFGYRCEVVNTGQIGDTVWTDTNANGVQDVGETPLAGVPVMLYLGTTLIGTQTTDANGHYLFTDLAAGTYTVKTDMSGFPTLVQTFDYDGLATPNAATYTLAEGEIFADTTGNSTGLDFGYRVPPRIGKIGDTVWTDTNANGVQDVGETPLAGVPVMLYLGTTLIGTQTTDANGHYLFTGLAAGTYTVKTDMSGFPTLVQTFDYDGLATPNAATYTLAEGETFADTTGNSTGLDFGYRVPPPIGKIGDTVWYDTNKNGVQNVGELGIPGVRVKLYRGTTLIGTKTTGAAGHYLFTGLAAGNYRAYVVASTLPAGVVQTFDYDGLATPNSAKYTLAEGQTFADTKGNSIGLDFGYVTVAPSVTLEKKADVTEIDPNKSVTYTYTVKNTGGLTLNNVVVKDDNATPNDTSDDFVVGTIPSLAPGAQAVLTQTKIPPVPVCDVIDGTTIGAGYLAAEVLANGDVKLTFVESRAINDNTYGNTASGWGSKGHTFNNLVGSDKAQFRVTDASGNVVMEFYLDYITASSLYPSGYGTLGATGGDGKMVIGSASNLVSYTTSLTQNLNQSSAYYGFTVNSPAEPDPNWNYNIMYQAVIKGSVFGTAGFGGFTIPSVHNSPPKIGDNLLEPKPCEADVTNTASLTATASDGTVLTATATASVHIKWFESPGPFTTYKQDQWGGSTANSLLAGKFATLYPSGLTVGGTYTIALTSAAAVDAFLPQGGGPNVLTMNYTNPTKTSAGELAGQVVALKLNVDFSEAGFTKKGLASLKLTKDLAGWTVAQVLTLAQTVLGGNKGALPSGVDLNKLKDICKKTNENYEKGTNDRGYLTP
ncbi:MAG: SdrD B-like domain-containing protein [Armatimonadia bacterium]